MLLSPNFTLDEFTRSAIAERNGIDNSLPDELLPNARRTADLLQEIRDGLLRPVHINSGFRCQEIERILNKKPWNWVSHRQHPRAEAADIWAPNISPLKLCLWVVGQGVKFDQLIYEGSWVHISTTERYPNRGEVLTRKRVGKKTTYVPGLPA